MPDDTQDRPLTVRFPRKGWVAAVLFGTLQIALLAVNVVLIERQREIADLQEDRTERTLALALPALRDARPLLSDARRDAPRVRRTARDTARLVRETRPLVDDLNDVDASRALAATGTLAATLLEDDRAVHLADRVTALADALLERDRLARLTDRADAFLRRAAEADLVGDVGRARDLAAEGVRIQRQALSIQRRTLAVQKEALGLIRETAGHARSIDRKTGGPAPGALP